MESLLEFYKNEDNLNTLLPIIQGESNLSLRVIDWFVTKYARNNKGVIYDIQLDNGMKEKFMVHLRYKAQLKAYSKKQFDPFCRRERIYLFLDHDGKKSNSTPVETTVGQLNFFRWAIENNVIEYIENNLDDINQCIKKDDTKNRKRRGKNSKNSKNTKKKPEVVQKEEKEIENTEEPFQTLFTVQNESETHPDMTDEQRKDLHLSATKKVTRRDVVITVKFN
jgi:hypothetical protein